MANPAIVSYPTRGQAPEIFALRLKFMDYILTLENINKFQKNQKY